MYVESQEKNRVSVFEETQAERIAEIIDQDREKGRRFLQEMGESDSDEAVQNLIDEWKGEAYPCPT